MWHYSAAGARLASEFELPGLRPGTSATGPADVAIRLGHVEDHLRAPTETGPAYEADATTFLLKSSRLRLRVTGGKEVVVDRLDATDDATVRTLLLGPGLAALCYQRGLLPLSATVVEMDGEAVGLVGASGSGKSTLGAFLVRRGHALLSEDLSAIGFVPEPVVHPGLQRHRLWRDVVDELGLDHRELAGDRPDLQRYGVEPTHTAARARPLARLYLLGARPDAPNDGFERLRRLDAVGALSATPILPALSPLVSGLETQFRQLVSLAGTAAVIRWTRRLDFAALPAQLDALEANVRRTVAAGG